MHPSPSVDRSTYSTLLVGGRDGQGTLGGDVAVVLPAANTGTLCDHFEESKLKGRIRTGSAGIQKLMKKHRTNFT